VIVAKIDNIADARPPTNLTSADIVYLLPVEGGLSRIFAVYSSRIPKVIGPVRSARQDDLALLRQFGTPGFAYSGATPHLLPFIARARVVNLYDTPAYFRDGNRLAPHNLYADGRTYTLPSGARMTFAPGQVWVVLTTTNWATAGL
jgi:hypothetical protein